MLAVLDLLFQKLPREIFEGSWTKFPAFASMRLTRAEMRREGMEGILLSCMGQRLPCHGSWILGD
jgi:hypothetical protein